VRRSLREYAFERATVVDAPDLDSCLYALGRCCRLTPIAERAAISGLPTTAGESLDCEQFHTSCVCRRHTASQRRGRLSTQTNRTAATRRQTQRNLPWPSLQTSVAAISTVGTRDAAQRSSAAVRPIAMDRAMDRHCGMPRGFLPQGLSDVCPQPGADQCLAARAGRCPTALNHCSSRWLCRQKTPRMVMRLCLAGHADPSP
jgi:hypothetical protein